MKIILVVTKDTVKGETTTPLQGHKNEADALRSWAMAINSLSKNNPDNVPIKDFQLYKVADFDTETLEITPDNKFLANAGEFIDYKSEVK